MELLTIASSHVMQRNDPIAVQHHKDIQEGFLIILTEHNDHSQARCALAEENSRQRISQVSGTVDA